MHDTVLFTCIGKLKLVCPSQLCNAATCVIWSVADAFTVVLAAAAAAAVAMLLILLLLVY
jgi:hypothetical protein